MKPNILSQQVGSHISILRKKGKPAFLPCKPSRVFLWPPPGPIPFLSPLAHQAPATAHFCAAQLTPSWAAFLFLPLHLQRLHSPCCSSLFQVLPSQKVLLPRSSSLTPFPCRLYFPGLGMPWAVTLVGWHPSGSLEGVPWQADVTCAGPIPSSLPGALATCHPSVSPQMCITWMNAWTLCLICESVCALPRAAFLPGESHGQRSLASCGPRGCKESDKTEVSWHTLPVWRKQIKAREK